MNNYDHKNIEQKWQKNWDEQGIYHVENYVPGKENYYTLVEFSYPSGNLHVGHWYAFSVPDIFARYKRMKGFNVLYPMGFDAFGLPAENAAIKLGADPKIWTYEQMEKMRVQLKSMGAMFDWNREIISCDPEYYKWTQWMFNQFLKNDLVYRAVTTVNWCPKDQTVLANEQVTDGKCERCGSEVVQRNQEQWMLRITKYADRLIDDLDGLNWPHAIKESQKNWIGRSEGSEISFSLNNSISNVIILHGASKTQEDALKKKDVQNWKTWLEHKLHDLNVAVERPFFEDSWQPDYQVWKDKFDSLDINSNTIFIAHSMGGAFAVRWLKETGKHVKKLILVAPAKIFSENRDQSFKDFYSFEIDNNYPYADEIILFTSVDEAPIHRQSQLEMYAKIKGIKVFDIPGKGHYRFQDIGLEFPELLEEIFKGSSIKVFTTRADTLFGVTYVVLAPEHSLVQELKLSIQNWDEVQEYISDTRKKSELDRQQTKEKTGIELKGIFAINPANNEQVPVWIADYVLAGYGTGAVMAVPAHDERDFEFAAIYELPIKGVVIDRLNTKNESNTLSWIIFSEQNQDYINEILKLNENFENIAINEIERRINNNEAITWPGVLINSEKFNGLTSEQAKKKITEFVNGKMVNTYRLRDWGISRQRFWGTPIPIVYDPEGKPHPIPDEHLPWVLPTDVDHNPDGTSPLARSQELLERTEKIFGKGWKPEVETMDTFVDSSWYFYRYLDPKNTKTFADQSARNAWMPVDLYMGGAEHTTMHLLYSRFWVKAMHDIGLVKETEAYTIRRNRGLILGPDGNKMSKSKGNVINPDEIVELLGADTVRLYLAFMGPYGVTTNYPWDPNGVVGVRRFLERVWKSYGKINADTISTSNLIHKTIKGVEEDMVEYKFNTAISKMMVLLNHWDKQESIPESEYKSLLQLLAPFAPHISEELWNILGEKESIHITSWPSYDANQVVDSTVILGVQINGKVRAEIEIALDADAEQVKINVLQIPEIQKWTEGKDIKKFIYIPGKIISIVI